MKIGEVEKSILDYVEKRIRDLQIGQEYKEPALNFIVKRDPKDQWTMYNWEYTQTGQYNDIEDVIKHAQKEAAISFENAINCFFEYLENKDIEIKEITGWRIITKAQAQREGKYEEVMDILFDDDDECLVFDYDEEVGE